MEVVDRTVKESMNVIRKAIQTDGDYAWGWHCNIAMSCIDAGASRKEGNEGAASFMYNCFQIDMKKSKYWESLKL